MRDAPVVSDWASCGLPLAPAAARSCFVVRRSAQRIRSFALRTASHTAIRMTQRADVQGAARFPCASFAQPQARRFDAPVSVLMSTIDPRVMPINTCAGDKCRLRFAATALVSFPLAQRRHAKSREEFI